MSKYVVIFTGLMLFVSFAFGQHQTYGHSAGNRPFLMPVDPVEILGEMESPSFFKNRDAYYGARRHDRKDNIPVFRPGNQPLGAQKQAALQAIIEDFQVNENAGPNGARQYHPAIAMNGAGNFVVVWEDERNGYYTYDIYAQRYAADGSALGANFRVNDNTSGSPYQNNPAIAMDDAGNFVVVWADGPNRDGYVYAQRYAADGSALGANFKVTEEPKQCDPAIAMDGVGNFVVVWTDGRDGDGEIYAQRYAADGTAVGAKFKVNEESGGAGPAIATDGDGNFVVVWTDDRDGDAEIYAQRYAADGTAMGANFKVNHYGKFTAQFSSAIAMDNDGNFMVVWEDERNMNKWDIYAQCYAADGTALGTNFKVNKDSEGSNPAIAMDNDGNFMVVWDDERNGYHNYDIYAQRYAADGAAIGANFKVNDDDGNRGQYNPVIAVDDGGNFMVVWSDFRNGDGDIYAQHYVADGNAVGTNFKINDDYGSSKQLFPAIAVDGAGNFMIVWVDNRNIRWDVYAQRYAADGAAVGANFKINDDTCKTDYHIPAAIAVDGAGNFVVAWIYIRNGGVDICAQRYAADGAVVGSNFRVNDDYGSSKQLFPAIAMDGEGNFVIVWTDQRNGKKDIYAQRFAADGTAVGGNFKVNDEISGRSQTLPAIAVDGAGNFMVVWVDGRYICCDVYAQRYAADGTAIGVNFKVNEVDGSVYSHSSPDIAMDGEGNFVVVWEDKRNGDRDIYAQRYAADGTAAGANFKVNEVDGSVYWDSSPAIAMDGEGNFVVVWEDERNGDRDIYAQRYAADGSVVGNNFIVNRVTKKQQSMPDVKLWQGRIYTTWVSNHAGGTSYDIWANVLDWNHPENKAESVVKAFQLFQNYPNPFNSITTIGYALPRTSHVKIEVFNLFGQKMATLVDETKQAGYHAVQFDGSTLASGVYYYRLETEKGFVQTRKLVLLK